jgi:hypothetical protein
MGRAGRGRWPLAILILVLAPLISGCYSYVQPSYHPGDARQVLLAISRHGVSVSSSVDGQSACADPGLIGNALHLRGSVASDPTPRDIWIYTFKSNKWDGSQPAVDACQTAYASTAPAAKITRLDIPTYRAFGADWSPELADAIRNALTEASTQGE